MIDLLIMIVQSVGQILTLIVVAHSIVQMLLPADYAVRRFLERIIEPLLRPIRRFIKPYRGVDFSPLALLILIMLLVQLLPRLILALLHI